MDARLRGHDEGRGYWRSVPLRPRRDASTRSCSASAPLAADLRLGRYFGLSEGFVLGLQTDYELMARRRQIADQLKAITPRAA
jgi:antitoxin HigA-1